MRNSAKIKLTLFPILLVVVITIGFGSVFAATTAGPVLTIPSNIPAQANSIVEIPISFTSDGKEITSIIFSVDYDQTWLQYDPGLSNAIVFTNIPDGYSKSCSYDAIDTDGELNCNIFGFGDDVEIMPNGTIVTIKLRTLGAPVGTVANVLFGPDPAPSFGNSQGQSEPGSGVNGSVYFGEVNWHVFLPLLLKITAVPTTATPTPVTPTPTPITPTPSSTPVTPSPTPPPPCSDIILNGDFEEPDFAWYLPTTNYPARYTSSIFHSGEASMRTGINLADNIYSYSSAWQIVSIPSGATSAELTFYYRPQTTEPLTLRLVSNLANLTNHPFENIESDPYWDQQMALILNEDTTHDRTLMSILSNSQTWTPSESYNLMNYVGKTIWIAFTTYNDGVGGKTAMYVDDVVLEVCQ